MDNAVLKKRLNTFKSSKSGQLRDVSDEVVMGVLRTWENWSGSAVELCRDLGLSKTQMATMIQKAKRLVKNGVIPESEFKEIKIVDPGPQVPGGLMHVVELTWDQGKVIRFAGVDHLVDFLKKVA